MSASIIFIRTFIQTLGVACIALALCGGVATADRLALNAPTCAQLTENYRLECRKACSDNKAQGSVCEKQCDTPEKLLEHLRRCEERMKSTPAKQATQTPAPV